MKWSLFIQVAALMCWSTVLVCSAAGYIIDKRRESDHHRKENGL